MKPCIPSFGFERSHQYEARYDIEEPVGMPSEYWFWQTGAEQKTPMYVKTYVRDVCVRCGDVIERGKSEKRDGPPGPRPISDPGGPKAA